MKIYFQNFFENYFLCCFMASNRFSQLPTQVPPPVPAGVVESVSAAVQGHQLKNWCCTIYPDAISASAEHRDTIVRDLLVSIGNECSWALFGLEICPTTKREHLQGYCMFESRFRLTALKKKFHVSIHWEPSRGTPSQNWDYCTKEDKDPVEFGERPSFDTNGEREKNLWTLTRQHIVDHDFDAIDDRIYITQFKNIMAIAKMPPVVTDALADYCGIWLWGVPGSGKSYKARYGYPGTNHYKLDAKWWDNYIAQDNAIMEDLDPSHAWMAHHLKCWADRYPFPVEIKGTAAVIRPKRIIVTSNYSIEEIFPRPVDQEALKLRFRQEYFPFRYGQTKADPEEKQVRFVEPENFKRVKTVEPLDRHQMVSGVCYMWSYDQEIWIDPAGNPADGYIQQIINARGGKPLKPVFLDSPVPRPATPEPVIDLCGDDSGDDCELEG